MYNAVLTPIEPQPTPRALTQDDTFSAVSLSLAAMMANALDELDYGIVIVDHQRFVLRANHMARCLCAAPDGTCQLQANQLRARGPGEDSVLHHAVQTAAMHARRSLLSLGVENRAETIAVVPLGRWLLAPVLLVFGKRQMCEALSVDHFSRVNGLTHAESMVLAALCDGDRPLEIAQRFGVAVSTVRTQISSIRQKTRTTSIRDLVRRIAVLPPIVSALGRAQAH